MDEYNKGKDRRGFYKKIQQRIRARKNFVNEIKRKPKSDGKDEGNIELLSVGRPVILFLLGNCRNSITRNKMNGGFDKWKGK